MSRLPLSLYPALCAALACALAPTARADKRQPLGAGDTIYQILVDRFWNGDPGNDPPAEALRHSDDSEDDLRYMHGGDWQGVIDRLPYIRDLGFSAIWISPVTAPQMWSRPDPRGRRWPTAYHGYNTRDPNAPNPHFGTRDKLRELVSRAHAIGLKVILDIVPNHLGDYLLGKSAIYDLPDLRPAPPFDDPSWYHHEGDVDWSREHPHTDENIRLLERGDLGGLDDLDHDHPGARAAMNRAVRRWFADSGADAARVDAAKCMKPSYLHELERFAGVPMFAEVFDNHVEFVRRWVGDGGVWGALDFPLFQALVNGFAKGENLDDTSPGAISLASVLARDGEYGLDAAGRPSAHHLVTFLDNHDRDRFLTEAGGDRRRLHAALTFLFAARGLPAVYQGTEQGLGNLGDRRTNGISDVWNRWCMAHRDASGRSIDDHFRADNDTYRHVARLNRLRRRYPALRSGTQREMWRGPHVYAFSRRVDRGRDAGGEIIVIAGNGDARETLDIPLRAESTLRAGTRLFDLLDDAPPLAIVAGGPTGRRIRLTTTPHTTHVYAPRARR